LADETPSEPANTAPVTSTAPLQTLETVVTHKPAAVHAEKKTEDSDDSGDEHSGSGAPTHPTSTLPVQSQPVTKEDDQGDQDEQGNQDEQGEQEGEHADVDDNLEVDEQQADVDEHEDDASEQAEIEEDEGHDGGDDD
jgi:hypothetical protein